MPRTTDASCSGLSAAAATRNSFLDLCRTAQSDTAAPPLRCSDISDHLLHCFHIICSVACCSGKSEPHEMDSTSRKFDLLFSAPRHRDDRAEHAADADASTPDICTGELNVCIHPNTKHRTENSFVSQNRGERIQSNQTSTGTCDR